MTNFDTSIATLIAVVVMGFIVLAALFRRPKTDDRALRSENQSLNVKIDQKDKELRDTYTRADRFEALAEERTKEITRLNGDLSKLRTKLDEEAEKLQQLTNTISRLESEMKSEKTASNEKIEFLTKLRQDMESKFRDLAQEALKVQGDAFSKANLEKLEATLTPLKEHVGHFEKALKDVHQETLKDREHLKAEIKQLSERSEQISQEAISLTRALKGDQQIQGAWGEMILENVLERSGLREGEEYETQAHRVGSDGERLRPDVVVRIPGGKTLIIDSKVSLVAYTDLVNSESEDQAADARKRHVVSLRGHINGLAEKDYQSAENATVDYVIMFVPIEGALSEALREDGKLTDHAIERNIMIATPTTLMMALRTIATVWAVERRNQNAEQIAERAGRLYDKVVGFIDNMENVGKRLGQAQDAYENAVGQLSRGRGNVLSQVETLKTLGAKTSKSISIEFDDSGDSPLIVERADE
jgi:DNA recombination protein RmuC